MKYLLFSSFLLLACTTVNRKNDTNEEEKPYLYGSWEEYDRKGSRLSPLIEPDIKWTITNDKIIDSTLYPIEIFDYEYYLKGDDIHIKNFSVLGDRVYRIIRLNTDTLVIKESVIPNTPPDSSDTDYYYRKVLMHTFDTTKSYYKIDIRRNRR